MIKCKCKQNILALHNAVALLLQPISLFVFFAASASPHLHGVSHLRENCREETSSCCFFQLLSIFCRQFLGVTVDRWNAHFRCFWGNFWSVRSLFLILNVFGLKCWTKHGTSPLVHVREVECLTGREPTNTKRSILVNSFCAVLLLSSAFEATSFEVHSKHTDQQICWCVLIPTHKTLC